jgi:stress response protein SCP2
MALGWDPIRVRGREAEIDLDASALIFAEHQLVDAAFYGQLTSKDGAVRRATTSLAKAKATTKSSPWTSPAYPPT